MDKKKREEDVEYFSSFGQLKGILMSYLLKVIQEAKVYGYIPTHDAGYITYVQNCIIKL